MKKRLLVGLFSLTFVLSVTLAACGGAKTNEGKNTGTTTAGTTEAAKAESTAAELKADVTIWVYPAFEKIDQFFNEKVNAEFKKKFSGVNATIEVIPYDGGPNKVNVAIASGSTPDGLIDTPMRINGYAAKNVLVSLDKELEGIKNDVYPGMIDASLVDGKRYVIPLFATGGYTFAVNSTLAKELGTYDMLPKDHVSWTQEDFKKFIKATTDKGKSKGVYGTALWAASQSSDAVIFSFMMSAGAKVFNDEKNKIILNSAEAVKGLDLLAGMVKEGIVMPGAATLKDEDSNTLFFNKKIVVEMTSGMWNAAQVEAQVKEGKIQGPFDVEVYEFPSFDGKSPKKAGYTPTGICIFKNTNDADKINATKEYALSFLKNDSLLGEFITNAGQVPIRPGLEIYKDSPMTAREAVRSSEFLKNADPWWGAQKPYWAEIRAIFYPEIQAVFTNTKTSQKALEDFVTKANDIVSKNEK